MKAEDIIKEVNIPEEECGVCYLHERAHEKLPKSILCPYAECGKEIYYRDLNTTRDVVIVGETNGYDAEENITRMIVEECPHCKKPIMFRPMPVIYNGNHDIYYTGGKKYIPEKHGEFNLPQSMKDKIINYHERVKAGENLEPWNLILWLERDVEAMVAEKLYEIGLKI